MYDVQYRFFGSHAEKVHALTKPRSDNEPAPFSRIVDVLVVAPLVGFLYGSSAERVREPDVDASIMLDQLNNERRRLEMNYKTIVLLDDQHEPDLEQRISKAFRVSFDQVSKEDEDWYECYVLGGVDKLYEKLIDDSSGPNGGLLGLISFLEELKERYY